MIEVEVHQQLRAFLREQGKPYWSHHLTMARLVARALRLGRSALMQTDALSRYQGRYRLSYLVPVLMWQGPVVLVAREAVQQRLLMVEIPQLRQWIQSSKSIRTGDCFPDPDFQGLLLTTPESWLSDRLHLRGRFPDGIPTILDGVDDLESWVCNQLTTRIHSGDWDELMLAFPSHTEFIRDARVQLTKTIFERPANPYECFLLEPYERQILRTLFQDLQTLSPPILQFPSPPAFPPSPPPGKVSTNPFRWKVICSGLMLPVARDSFLSTAVRLRLPLLWLQSGISSL